MKFFMLNLEDFWVALAIWSNVLITLVCIIYGVWNWNNHGDGNKSAAEDK